MGSVMRTRDFKPISGQKLQVGTRSRQCHARLRLRTLLQQTPIFLFEHPTDFI